MDDIDEIDVQVLPRIPIEETIELYQELQKITLGLIQKNERKDFHIHRACIFGKSITRGSNKITESAASKKYPLLNDLIMNMGKKYCPFSFNSVNVNQDLVCTKHKDGNNTSKSMLISIGEYTGCKIVIEGEVYDAHDTPIIFDGRNLEHWNTNDLIGNKYSMVFYTISCEKKTKVLLDSQDLTVSQETGKIKAQKKYRDSHKDQESARHQRYMSNPENVAKIKAQKQALNIPTKCVHCESILLKYGMPKHVRVCHQMAA